MSKFAFERTLMDSLMQMGINVMNLQLMHDATREFFA